MARDRTLACLEVGATKICALLGTQEESGVVQIRGIGIVPSKGVRRGRVVNLQETAEGVRNAVQRAERTGNAKMTAAYVNITGSHLHFQTNRGTVAVHGLGQLVTEDDIRRAIEASERKALPDNTEVIHALPRHYILDSHEGVKHPLGMRGEHLGVETHFVVAPCGDIDNLVRCVEQGGVRVSGLVMDALAGAEAALREEEKDIGVILADVGGDTTSLAIFSGGCVVHLAVLPVGGSHLSRDIAIGFRASLDSAEEIKIKYGHAVADRIGLEERTPVLLFGQERLRPLSRRRLCYIIQTRLEEILELIYMEIQRSGYEKLLPAGLVLTGGTANLPGIADLAREMWHLPVRIGNPRGIHGAVDTVSGPAYATSVGLLLWAATSKEGVRKLPGNGHHYGEIYRNLFSRLKALFP